MYDIKIWLLSARISSRYWDHDNQHWLMKRGYAHGFRAERRKCMYVKSGVAEGWGISKSQVMIEGEGVFITRMIAELSIIQNSFWNSGPG